MTELDYGELKTKYDTVCIENDALYALLDEMKFGAFDGCDNYCIWCKSTIDNDNNLVHSHDCPYYKAMHAAGRL